MRYLIKCFVVIALISSLFGCDKSEDIIKPSSTPKPAVSPPSNKLPDQLSEMPTPKALPEGINKVSDVITDLGDIKEMAFIVSYDTKYHAYDNAFLRIDIKNEDIIRNIIGRFNEVGLIDEKEAESLTYYDTFKDEFYGYDQYVYLYIEDDKSDTSYIMQDFDELYVYKGDITKAYYVDDNVFYEIYSDVLSATSIPYENIYYAGSNVVASRMYYVPLKYIDESINIECIGEYDLRRSTGSIDSLERDMQEYGLKIYDGDNEVSIDDLRDKMKGFVDWDDGYPYRLEDPNGNIYFYYLAL